MKKCLLLFIITMIVSCDLTDLKLSLVNNTNKAIYFHLSYDTIITNNKEYLESSNIFPAESVNPHFARGSRGGKGAWEYHISDKSKDSTLHIFFLCQIQSNTMDGTMV